MALRDRIQVNAPGEQVWDVLDDPSLMELWNPKCVRCEVGCEHVHLHPHHDGTLVIHEVDFTHSGLPRWLQVFMKVMDLVGRKAGKSSLDGIKELAEEPGE